MKRSFIMNCMIIITCLMVFMLPDCSGTKTAQKQAGLDYLAIVRSYADIMIEHGRDVYGTEHTPLFAVALDRHTFSIPEGGKLRYYLFDRIIKQYYIENIH